MSVTKFPLPHKKATAPDQGKHRAHHAESQDSAAARSRRTKTWQGCAVTFAGTVKDLLAAPNLFPAERPRKKQRAPARSHMFQLEPLSRRSSSVQQEEGKELGKCRHSDALLGTDLTNPHTA